MTLTVLNVLTGFMTSFRITLYQILSCTVSLIWYTASSRSRLLLPQVLCQTLPWTSL